MKKLSLSMLIIALLLAWPSLAFAQEEPPKYSFASAQGSANLQAIPGGQSSWGVIYFYNVDGNRITHIALEVVEAPDNWEVEIDPPLHQIQVSFGGAVIPVIENLNAPPTEVYAEEIEDVPDGMVVLALPNKLGPEIPGYTIATPAYIKVQVPASEEVGVEGDIHVHAVASWLGQAGAAAITQERDFYFNVDTVYEITEELIVWPFDWNKWMPTIIAGAIGVAVAGLLGVIYIPRLVANRRKRA